MNGKTADVLWLDARRGRLVRLCAAVSGDGQAAEDLAQETLLEAWRNRHKLHDPAGADRWLAAIARNVCRRWARGHGRDIPAAAPEPADAVDVEAELERAELVELLDNALALLPPATRDVLVERYVHDSPHADIAARLGVSEDAVSMRLSRGRVMLRRLLAEPSPDEWQETRVWCSQCGAHRLLMLCAPETVAFRCPGCEPDASAAGSQFPLANPFFARLVGDLVRPKPILTRAAEWTRTYFTAGVGAPVPCTRCGKTTPLRRYRREGVFGTAVHGLYAECAACGDTVSSSLGGMALAAADVRQFRRDHPRVRSLPTRDAGDGLVVGYRDVRGSAGVDIIFARDSLRVLDVRSA
jgi:RNA polymerase sigma-70 factor (ECF subfamily)